MRGVVLFLELCGVVLANAAQALWECVAAFGGMRHTILGNAVGHLRECHAASGEMT